jgi:H+-transporting ATPase
VPGSKPAARAAADCSTEAQGLDSILDAVQTSRRAIGLMQGYLLYRTTETFRVLLTVTIAVLALGFVPLTSVMLLLLFILNDGTALWLSAGKGSPEMVSVECTDREKWIPVDLVIAGTVMLLGLIYAGNAVFGIVGAELQSFVFLGVVVSGQLLLPSVAVRKYFWKAMSEGRALLFVGASPVVATVLVTFGILMPAIQGNEILFVWGYSLGTALLMNVIKIQLQKWAALT